MDSLTYSLSENESLTFGSASGQPGHIALPLTPCSGEGDCGRVYGEQGRWYLESFLEGLFDVNESGLYLEKYKPRELSDGDIISCLGFSMMMSDFSPWDQSSEARLQPLLPENVQPEGGMDTEPVQCHGDQDLNDPFLMVDSDHKPVTSDTAVLALTETFQLPKSQQNMMAQGSKSELIDVLSDQECIENLGLDESLWSLQRQIKHQKDLLDHFPHKEKDQKSLEDFLQLDNLEHYFSQALLVALDKVVNDLSPLNLLKQVKEDRGLQDEEKEVGLWHDVKNQYVITTENGQLHQRFLSCVQQTLQEKVK